MHYYLTLIKNVPQLLTYQAKEAIPVGSLVKVTLGRRSVHGVTISETPAPAFECSEIETVLITEAISPLQIELCRWMSTYYISSLQKCIQLFIPTVIWNAKMKVKVKDGQLKNPDADQPSKPYHDQPLTAEQKNILEIINSPQTLQTLQTPSFLLHGITGLGKTDPSTPFHSAQGDKGRCFLLHGVTGSGKTEIYLQIVKKNIAAGLQTVLLVPEIAITTELIQYFSAHFPDQISIIHSKLSNGQRVQSWHRIHQGKTKLILGSRSALFTPWKALGAIIIDEEHEWNYKQEQSPRYHAKTVAEQIVDLSLRTQDAVIASAAKQSVLVEIAAVATLPRNDVPILILGSATPSVESYFSAEKTDGTRSYQLLNLTHRANLSYLPPVTVVDLRDEYKKKNFSMFSDTLQQAIRDRLERKEQVILFLNKRGSSSSVTCRDCGYSPRCPNCDIALTYHSKLNDFINGGLICHYCGHFEANLSSCPICKSVAIRHLGSGTQKAEDQLQQLFPEARILRADKDTTTGKYDFEELYHQMKDGKADILLGTQMITKGLDLENVTLTGVLIADIGLHLPDFRASERVFQLLTQVAGRSGRHKPGEVIIQTYQPDHPAITFAKNHDYSGFYQYEIAIREQFLYPPFSKLIKLIYADENQQYAENEAKRLFLSFRPESRIRDGVEESLTRGSVRDPSPPSVRLSDRDGQGQGRAGNSVGMTKGPPIVDLSPNYIPRLHRKYVWNIFLRGENPREMLKGITLPAGWKIDMDPR